MDKKIKIVLPLLSFHNTNRDKVFKEQPYSTRHCNQGYTMGNEVSSYREGGNPEMKPSIVDHNQATHFSSTPSGSDDYGNNSNNAKAGYGSCATNSFTIVGIDGSGEEESFLFGEEFDSMSTTSRCSSSNSNYNGTGYYNGENSTFTRKTDWISERPPKRKKNTGTGFKITVLAMNCIMSSIYCLMRRYSQGILKETYNVSEVMVVAEAVKVVIFGGILYIQKMRQRERTDIEQQRLMAHSPPPIDDSQDHYIYYLISTSGSMSVLAIIWAGCHVASYSALRYLSAGVVSTGSQAKLLVVAFFSILLVGRRYSTKQWGAMILLIVGVIWYNQIAFHEIRHNPTITNHSAMEFADVLQGFAGLAANVVLSGLGSVYFERYVKKDSKKVIIWESNFQCSFVSFFIFVAIVVCESGERPIGAGWSWMALFVAFAAGIAGLCSSLVIFYCDSVRKCLSTSVGVILTSILDHILFGGPLTPNMMLAAVVIMFALYIYTSENVLPRCFRSGNLEHDTTDPAIARAGMDDCNYQHQCPLGCYETSGGPSQDDTNCVLEESNYINTILVYAHSEDEDDDN